MTHRERVCRAIHFAGPDRVPHYLPDGKENDLLWLWPDPSAEPRWKALGGSEQRIDEWGVLWERRDYASFGEAVEWPIKDITRQIEYRLPDLNNASCYAKISRRVAENNRSTNPKYCLAVMPFSSLNEGTHNIMGLQNMFIAYHEQPGALQALIARLATAQRESIQRLADSGCDGVMGYDDWGLQDRTMVSTETFNRFFVPHYRQNWKLAHDMGIDVWLHSCGWIVDVLPILIDAGLDVIQMDQQENMGLDNLNERFGGKIAFWCPADIQKVMSCGSIEDVQSYVKRMVGTLGAHNGGLVSMAYSSPNAAGHTPEKTAAMCAAFREYGKYSRA